MSNVGLWFLDAACSLSFVCVCECVFCVCVCARACVRAACVCVRMRTWACVHLHQDLYQSCSSPELAPSLGHMFNIDFYNENIKICPGTKYGYNLVVTFLYS